MKSCDTNTQAQYHYYITSFLTTLRKTNNARSENSWAWILYGDLKRNTETVKVAAQNQITRG